MDLSQLFSLAASELLSPLTAGYILCAIGLALHFGFTGLLNFGQAAFAALGAYGYSLAVINFGWDWWQAVLFGLVCSLAFAAFKMAVGSSTLSPITGGSAGVNEFGKSFYALNPIPEGEFNLGIVSYTHSEVWVRIVGWSLVALAAIIVAVLSRSPWGRVLKGIREDEDAVRSLGKNVFSYKLQSLVIGGAFASIGGMVFVMSSQSNQPTFWGNNFTFLTWTVLLLGGAATVLGPIVGGMVFFTALVIIESILSFLVEVGVLSALGVEQVAQIRFILIGVTLMLLVIFRPQGFFGNKKELQFNG
jgi:branched-chain amino acid transport system permease protein